MIRKAIKKDLPRLLELFNSDANLIGDDRFLYDENCIKEYLTNPVNKMSVYTIKGKIVGAILIEIWKQAKFSYFSVLIVDKEYKKKGIGTALHTHAEKMAKKSGITLIYFFSNAKNTSLHKMVKKLNFEKGKPYFFFSKAI